MGKSITSINSFVEASSSSAKSYDSTLTGIYELLKKRDERSDREFELLAKKTRQEISESQHRMSLLQAQTTKLHVFNNNNM